MDGSMLPLTYYQKYQMNLMLDTCNVPWSMVTDRLMPLICLSSEMDRDKFFFHMMLHGSAVYNLLAYDMDREWRQNYDEVQRAHYNKLRLL